MFSIKTQYIHRIKRNIHLLLDAWLNLAYLALNDNALLRSVYIHKNVVVHPHFNTKMHFAVMQKVVKLHM